MKYVPLLLAAIMITSSSGVFAASIPANTTMTPQAKPQTNTPVTQMNPSLAGGSARQLYVAGKDGKVSSFWKTNLTTNGISSGYGSGLIYTIAIDDTYLYAGGGQGPNTVYQYWRSNLTKKAESSSYGAEIFKIIANGDFLYVGGSAGDIKQYRKSDLANTGVSGWFGAYIRYMISDGTYIYAVGMSGQVIKYTMPSLTVAAESTDYEDQLWEVATDGTYVYAAGESGCIIKYQASDLTKVGQTITTGGNVRGLTVDNQFVYAGGDTQAVYQFWKSNLTLRCVSENYGGHILELFTDGVYLYVGGFDTDRVYQYWTANMTRRATTLPIADIETIVAEPTPTPTLTGTLQSKKGMTLSITNNGPGEAWDLSCTLKVQGGLFHRINITTSNATGTLTEGDALILSTGRLFGLGLITIEYTQEGFNVVKSTETKTAKIFLFFITNLA